MRNSEKDCIVYDVNNNQIVYDVNNNQIVYDVYNNQIVYDVYNNQIGLIELFFTKRIQRHEETVLRSGLRMSGFSYTATSNIIIVQLCPKTK